MFELIQIETTTACNSQCKMCPRALVTRSTHSEFMREDVFWLAVEQAYELGVRHVVPFIDGEPLMDKRIVDFIEELAKTYPDVVVGWYTNGSMLTESIIRRLLTAGNIKDFNVSMQGGDKKTYEATTGLSWERILANMDLLVSLNAELCYPVTIRANMCVFDSTRASVEAFRGRWQAKGALVCLGTHSNFGGKSPSKDFVDAPRRVCDRALKHFYVFWNGDVGQCCFDTVPTAVYGNITKQSLAEIARTPRYQAMQSAHRALDVAAMPTVCQLCNSNKFHG